MACRVVNLLPPIIPDSSFLPRMPVNTHLHVVESAGRPGIWDGADVIGIGSSIVKSIMFSPALALRGGFKWEETLLIENTEEKCPNGAIVSGQMQVGNFQLCLTICS